MSSLIIPCYIKTQWDINCLDRLLDSVQQQTQRFDKVYLIDDASPLKYKLKHDFVEFTALGENGGPAKARNIGIEKAISTGAEYLLFTDHDCILDRPAKMAHNEQGFAMLGDLKNVKPRTAAD